MELSIVRLYIHYHRLLPYTRLLLPPALTLNCRRHIYRHIHLLYFYSILFPTFLCCFVYLRFSPRYTCTCVLTRVLHSWTDVRFYRLYTVQCWETEYCQIRVSSVNAKTKSSANGIFLTQES